MSLYQPEKFLVLKLGAKNFTTYKLFGTWMGGYLHGDSWRLNSGITKVTGDGKLLDFESQSGAIYRVHKDTYGASVFTQSIVDRWVAESGEDKYCSIMPGYINWTEFDWREPK